MIFSPAISPISIEIDASNESLVVNFAKQVSIWHIFMCTLLQQPGGPHRATEPPGLRIACLVLESPTLRLKYQWDAKKYLNMWHMPNFSDLLSSHTWQSPLIFSLFPQPKDIFICTQLQQPSLRIARLVLESPHTWIFCRHLAYAGIFSMVNIPEIRTFEFYQSVFLKSNIFRHFWSNRYPRDVQVLSCSGKAPCVWLEELHLREERNNWISGPTQ